MALIWIKILLLLWAVNMAPPVLGIIFGRRWAIPLDFGYRCRDGNPLFGHHKTVRGVSGAILTGGLAGLLFGLPFAAGLAAGTLSMAGDLASSYVKRRYGKPSGSLVPGLDQVPEGLLPFIILAPYYHLGLWNIVTIVLVFSAGALAGSFFLEAILLSRPFDDYHRPLEPRTRFREWRSCQSIKNPAHLLINIEQPIFYSLILKNFFSILGLYDKGVKNALDVRVTPVTFHFENLPEAFDGYTILFMSDFHLDGLDGLTEKLGSMVEKTPVDLCILGGDYRTKVYGSFSRALLRLVRLVRKVQATDGIYAVLGNHDCLEMIGILEKRGVRFLVNDSAQIERDGEKIWIAGVDDPFYYEGDDLESAFEEIPEDGFSILVSHAPRIYREAADYSPGLYLCGHTHAGQIQLPVIGPVITHSMAPRRFAHGRWRYRGMQGYTSSGVGVSGIPVRFNCRGELALITLRKGGGPTNPDT